MLPGGKQHLQFRLTSYTLKSVNIQESLHSNSGFFLSLNFTLFLFSFGPVLI